MSSGLRVPPSELLQRVGRIDDPDVVAAYEAIGRRSRERIERLLPANWSWEGKRVLDFGCGAGRTLRHFLAEAEHTEFYGCDIDRPSIAWLTNHFSPPFEVFENDETPSLAQPAESFDLVYALSVFTHLADHWADWLLELHRMLKPDGLLIATFLNEGLWPEYGRGQWDEDRVGMNVIKKWNPWDTGGPIVFHSEWWVREHWGRAFEVRSLERLDPAVATQGQGAVLLRRREERPLAAELKRPANDSRELAAAQQNLEQLHQEADELYTQLSDVTASHAAQARDLEELRPELEQLRDELATIADSRSWRLTAPLRRANVLLRKLSL